MKNTLKKLLIILLFLPLSLEILAQSTSSGVGTGNSYSSGKFLGWGTTSGDLEIRTNNVPRILVKNSTGFVGVGTANPNQRLTVQSGNINANTLTTGYMINNQFVLRHNGITSNILVGINAGAFNSGINCTMVGTNAGAGNNGNACTFIGRSAGAANGAVDNNTYLGAFSGWQSFGGHHNLFAGAYSIRTL
jgi:hypothetical protein